jgi:hypothetical protein
MKISSIRQQPYAERHGGGPARMKQALIAGSSCRKHFFSLRDRSARGHLLEIPTGLSAIEADSKRAKSRRYGAIAQEISSLYYQQLSQITRIIYIKCRPRPPGGPCELKSPQRLRLVPWDGLPPIPSPAAAALPAEKAERRRFLPYFVFFWEFVRFLKNCS